jgi:hypothetical protein
MTKGTPMGDAKWTENKCEINSNFTRLKPNYIDTSYTELDSLSFWSSGSFDAAMILLAWTS